MDKYGKLARVSALAMALLVALGPVAAGAQELLTLSGALELANNNSIEAKFAELDKKIALEDSAQVKSLYYPKFNVEGGHVNLDSDPAFKMGPLTVPASEQVYWKYKIYGHEVLWDGGRRSSGLRASRSREEAVALKGSSDVSRLQAEVVGRYMALMSIKAQKRVIALRRKALAEHLRTVNDLFENGVVARNDLLRTEVALRTVEDSDRSLDTAYATVLESLNIAIGLDPKSPHELPENLPLPPPAPCGDIECRERGAAGNDGVKALGAKIKALEDQLSMKRKEYYPNFFAEAGHSYEQNRYFVHPHVNSLFVGMSLNIYDGGVKASKIRQARSELEKAQRELVQARRTVEATIGQALREYMEALEEIETARANLLASSENLRIIKDQYKEGLVRTTDVLDAEAILAESRSGLALKRFSAYEKQAVLLSTMGEDLVAFYRDLPEGGPGEEL